MGLCLAGLRAALRGASQSLSLPAHSISCPVEVAGRQWHLPAPSFTPRSPFPAFMARCCQPWLSRQPWPGRTHSFRAKHPTRCEQMTVSSVGAGSRSAGPGSVCWQCSRSRIGSLAMGEGWARASSWLGTAPAASFPLAVGVLRQPGSFLGGCRGAVHSPKALLSTEIAGNVLGGRRTWASAAVPANFCVCAPWAPCWKWGRATLLLLSPCFRACLGAAMGLERGQAVPCDPW